MQAQMSRDGEVIVVHLRGRIDIESANSFRDACMSVLARKQVVFSFKDLSFVGSSGILPFLETMQKLSMVSPGGFKFCQVGSEFRKVFAASPLGHVEIYDTEEQAATAFVNGGQIPSAVHAAPLMNDGFGVLSLNSEPDEVDAKRGGEEGDEIDE